jgi:hypothetical protein
MFDKPFDMTTTLRGPDGPEEYAPSVWEAQLFPDETAAWAVSVTPGSATVGPLAVLDADTMSQPGRVDSLVAYDTLAAWVAARQLRVLAAMADDPMTSSPAPMLDKQWVKEGVRAALGESAVGAGARLALATQLRHRLPDTLTAPEQGRITLRHARYLCDAVAALDEDVARTIEADVLAARPGATWRPSAAR